MDFQNSLLFVSARSPFARRVRVALMEHQVPFEERVLDVFKINPELARVNPLSRVPTLVLKSGEVLVDSHFILRAFYEEFKGSSFLAKDYYWSALATGLMEKCVEYYLEMLRPEEQRDLTWVDEIDRAVNLSLEALDQQLKGKETILGVQPTQADLDWGVALAYLSLRYSDKWKTEFPKLDQYFQKLDDRPSFQKTRPPK